MNRAPAIFSSCGGGQDLLEEAVQARQVLDDLHEPHHRQVLHVRQLAVQEGRHARATHADDPQLGTAGLELPQELGTVQVTRIFAGND